MADQVVPGGGAHNGAQTNANAQAPSVDMLRAMRYIEWCKAYGLSPVSEALVAFRLRLKTLQLTRVTAGDLLPICEILRYDDIVTTLDCSGSSIGNAGCFVLAQRLFGGADDGVLALGLHELRLDHCDIGEAGASVLFRHLEHSNMRRVTVRGNRIGTAGAEALARCLRRMRTLHYVDCSNNFLRRKGVQTITQALLQRAQARLDRKARSRAAAAAALAAEQRLDAPALVAGPHGPVHVHGPGPAQGQGQAQGQEGEAGGAAHGGGAAAAAAAPAAPHRQVPQVASGRGWGWLWGESNSVVVTTNSVVRTDWKRLSDALPQPTNAAAAGRTRPTPTNASTAAAAAKKRQRAGSADGGGASAGAAPAAPATGASPHKQSGSAADDDDDELDVEVKISGNLVREEIFNSVIHGVGLLLSLLGAVPLLSHARSVDPTGRYFVGAVLYLVGLISFYASSTLNHSLFLTDSQQVFRLIDHSAVYAMIAGTFTPFLLTNLRGMQLSTVLLAAVWGLALVGIGISTTCPPETLQRRLRLFLYLAMGWCGLLPYSLLHSCVSNTGWALLAGGGVVFSAGVFLYVRERRVYGPDIHGVWYVLVLLASILHFLAVYHHVQPPTEQCAADARGLGLLVADEEATSPTGLPRDMAFTSTLANAAVAAAADGKRAVVDSMRQLLQQMITSLDEVALDAPAALGQQHAPMEL